MLMFVALPHALAAKPLTEQRPLVLGVHPYKSAAKLVASYKPLANYLSRKTGRTITVKIAKDYRTHIQLIGENKLDIAYMGPASYVKLVKRYGKKPLLARQAIHDSPTFQGKIVVRQDSTVSSLAGIAGKRFAFGDSASTMSHLVPRYMLRQAGLTVDQLAVHRFLGSHDNVALAVLAGDFDVGGVKEAVFYKYKARGLKVLATTPALSEHLFVTRNKLPAKIRRDLREALLALKDDPKGSVIMAGIKPGMTAWVPVTDADYNNLRTILDALAKAGIKP
jgi:phosphonate transport system substrate-binding protein